MAALQNDTWIQDLRRRNADDIAVDFIVLWRAIRSANIHLTPAMPCSIQWRFEASSVYSTNSAYDL